MLRKEPKAFCGHLNISTANEVKDEKFTGNGDIFFDVQKKSGESFREQESEVTLDSLVSAPMVAVSKANATMLSGQVQFILDYCFKKTKFRYTPTDNQPDFGETDCYDPVMVNLVVQRQNFKQEEVLSIDDLSTIISIPILTLLPINSLAIDKIRVDFRMDITSISSKRDNSENPQSKKTQLSGKLLGDKNDGDGKSTSSRGVSVNVKASKLPLPIGLLSIIQYYSKM